MPNNTLQARQKQSQLFSQHENAAILYSVNWAAELDTDTISTSTWTTEASGSTITDETNTTNSASARLSGDVGQHVVTNKVVTAAGDTKERQLIIQVRDNDSIAFVRDYCS